MPPKRSSSSKGAKAKNAKATMPKRGPGRPKKAITKKTKAAKSAKGSRSAKGGKAEEAKATVNKYTPSVHAKDVGSNDDSNTSIKTLNTQNELSIFVTDPDGYTASLDDLEKMDHHDEEKNEDGEEMGPVEYTEENSHVRCVCDDTDENSPLLFVACDECDVWQHPVCVGMDADDVYDLPDTYYCEQCAPEQHQSLVRSISLGAKPWIQYRLEWEAKEALKLAQQKKAERSSKSGKDKA